MDAALLVEKLARVEASGDTWFGHEIASVSAARPPGLRSSWHSINDSIMY
jgi:hypothetical protein